ncbi:toll-like receptor 5 [Rhinophrynus dorsalis]
MIDQTAMFSSCNLTQMPDVHDDTAMLILNFNYIMEVNSTFFPELNQLLVLYLGSQKTNRLTIQKDSFRRLPNLILLDVAFNQLLILDPDAFAGLSRLQQLFLYYNGLNGTILENDFFKDLISLQYVDLSSNEITYLRPNPLFYYLHSFHLLDLKFNKISSLCEGELHSFQRKTFTVLDISSNHLYKWDTSTMERCGNPFRNINFDTLILSFNGFNVDRTQKLCNAIKGTKLVQLKLSHHTMGANFGYHNLKDPDNTTFMGLVHSNLQILDLSVGSIFSLNPYTFENLSNLAMLNLAENKINRIEEHAFYGLQSLSVLNLSYNLLGEIYDHSFNGLTNVTLIDLQQNHIGAIQTKAFENLIYLNTLNLRDNAIKTITFSDNMLTLGYIFFGGNKMKKIDSTRLNATFVDLSDNQLYDLWDLYKLLQYPFLEYLILRRNRFSVCYPFSNISKNNSLIHLDLSENMIQLVWGNRQCWNVFQELSTLRVLRLSNNFLSFLPEGIFDGLTSLQTLNLSSNLLTHLYPGMFPANLETLDLSKNQLLSPNPEIFASLKTLDITDNMYSCDCSLVSLIIWLNETNTTLLGSQNDIYCAFPKELVSRPLYSLTVDNCDENIVLRPVMFSLFLFNTVIIILFMTSVIVYTHFRGFCFALYKKTMSYIMNEQKCEESNEIYKYDAFFCYSSKDFQWVQDTFFKNLDSQYCDQNRFRLCFEERDFIPGEDHIVNIRDAIWNSKKTICIVTKQFLKDGWCVEAFNYAQSRYFTDLKDVLIMVVVGSLTQYQLMKYKPIRSFVQRCQYLKWPEDYQDVDWFLSRLSYQILKEKKVEIKKLNGTTNSSTLELQNIATIS